MELGQLRRRVARIQVATATALPAAYLAAMVAGVFLFVLDFLLLVCVFDVLLFFQMRSHARARTVTTKGGSREGPAPPREVLDAADRRFLRFVAADAVVSICGFLFFLLGLDLWARARIGGGDGGPALLGGAVIALVIIAAGRVGARRTAWGGFPDAHRSLWESPTGLNRGKSAVSVAAYMDWREDQGTGEGGPPGGRSHP